MPLSRIDRKAIEHIIRTVGSNGPPGPQGDPGPPGIRGADGLPGSPGTTGLQGPTGPAIYLDADTLEGEPGVPGQRGLDGVSGSPGITGSQGPIGPAVYLIEPGEEGEPGRPGSQGNPGTTGQQGPSGPAIYLLDSIDQDIYMPDGPLLVDFGAVVTPAIPASTVAVFNKTGRSVTIYIKGGTLTVVSIGGIATGISAAASSGAVHSVELSVNRQITITYSVAPTWVWISN